MQLTSDSAVAAIKTRARELGFHEVGVAAAGRLPEDEAGRFREWLRRQYHGGMGYMERGAEKRIDPSILLEGVRSIVVVAMNYYREETPSQDPAVGRVSRYARGRDYHDVLGERLRVLAAFIGETTGGRTVAGVDTKPIMEKYWAERAGIGWRGKHANVITRGYGSWVFLGAVLTEADLVADTSAVDRCGTCVRCIDACPTVAIVEPGVVDARRCISYLTIEHRGPIDPPLRPAMGNHVFGCDICQDVCPWNRFQRPSDVEDFAPRHDDAVFDLRNLMAMDDGTFKRLFRESAVARAKGEGMRRNAAIAAVNAGLIDSFADEKGVGPGGAVEDVVVRSEIDDKH